MHRHRARAPGQMPGARRSKKRVRSVHALGERARLVAEKHLDLVAVDDPGDDAVAELLVEDIVALLEARAHAVSLELVNAAPVEGVLPCLLVLDGRRDARRARGPAARRGARPLAGAGAGTRPLTRHVGAPEVRGAARQALDLMSLAALHGYDSMVQDEAAACAPAV